MKSGKRKVVTPWPAQTKRRSRDFDVKKVAILDAAAHLFRERGYEGTSLDELAKALKVTKPALYYYFSNKQEILRSIKARTHDEIVRMLVEVRASKRRGIDMLAEVLRQYTRIITSDYGRVLASVNDRLLSKKTQLEFQDWTSEIDSHHYAIYEQAIAEGDMCDIDRRVIHYTLFGTINWIPNWYNPEGRIKPDKLSGMLVQILLDGVRTRK